MGKNHRHTKKLKSEKAKTQITSKTKFLPKGLNVTNTAFKIRPIVLPEQLKDRNAAANLSKSHQSIPELLAKLKHYNENFKIEACGELTDLVKKHTVDVVRTQIAPILQNASVLVQDRERKVRKAAVKLINCVLENAKETEIAPFFNFISTNLRCAMTNIDQNIQEDSLFLLDALLETVPGLVAANFEKLFPDFLTLISKLRSDSGLDRTLTVNLGSKITSVKWRIKVLTRLYSILDAMIENQPEIEEKSKDSVTIIVDSDTSHVGLFKNAAIFNQSGDYTSSAGKCGEILAVHVVTLVPLLYETWLEVLPEKNRHTNSGSENTILPEESAAILNCIVHILDLLLKYAQISKMGDIFAKSGKFLDYLLLNFPYCHNRRGANSKQSPEMRNFPKLFDPQEDPKCVKENLMIVNLFLVLKINLQAKTLREKITQVTSYLNRCLTSKHYLNSRNFHVITPILREVLLDNRKFWLKRGLNAVEVLENAVKCQGIPREFQTEFLDILTANNADLKSPVYQTWLADLPALLCEQKVPFKIIQIILKLSREKHELILDSVAKYRVRILGNLGQVTITGTCNSSQLLEAKLMLVHIFYYQEFNEALIRDIRVFMEDNFDSEWREMFRAIWREI